MGSKEWVGLVDFVGGIDLVVFFEGLLLYECF